MEVDLAFETWIRNSEKIIQQNEKMLKRGCKPIHRPVVGSLTGVTGSQTLITNDSVDAGRVWNVLKIGIFGNDGHTVLASAIADIYAAAGSPELPDFSAQLVSGSAIPNIIFIPEKMEWMHYGESIIALLYALPANSNVSLIAKIADYPIEAVEATAVE